MGRNRYTKRRYEPARQVFSDTGPVEIISVEDELSPVEESVNPLGDAEENMKLDEQAVRMPSTPGEVVDAQEKLEDESMTTVQVEPEGAVPAEDPGESSESMSASESPTDTYPAVDSAAVTSPDDYDPQSKAQKASEFMQDALHQESKQEPKQDNGFTITAEGADG